MDLVELHSSWQDSQNEVSEIHPLLPGELTYCMISFSIFSSVHSFSHILTLRPHGLLHARLSCPPIPGACSNSCPLSQWCHPTVSSSVIPFSSSLQSFTASGSFPVSQFFASGGQRIAVSTSASVLPVNIHDCYLGISIFLKKHLVFPIPLFPTVSLHCSLKKAFVSLLAVLWNSSFCWVYLSLFPLHLLLFFPQLFVRPPQTTTLSSFISFY